MNPEQTRDLDPFNYIQEKPKQSKPAKKLSKTQKKNRKQFLTEASNVLMPSSDEYYSSYDSNESYFSESDDLSRKVFGKNQEKSSTREHTIYCAICAGKHPEKDCRRKGYSRSD